MSIVHRVAECRDAFPGEAGEEYGRLRRDDKMGEVDSERGANLVARGFLRFDHGGPPCREYTGQRRT